MKACIQRVRRARVLIGGEVSGEIGTGLVVLLGVAREDSEADARVLAEKVSGLRVFEDDQEKMNRAVSGAGGSVLVVRQFTLLGNCRKGRRPGPGPQPLGEHRCLSSEPLDARAGRVMGLEEAKEANLRSECFAVGRPWTTAFPRRPS